MPVHTHAEAEDWYVGPHWATTFGYTVAQKTVPMFGCFAKIYAA